MVAFKDGTIVYDGFTDEFRLSIKLREEFIAYEEALREGHTCDFRDDHCGADYHWRLCDNDNYNAF